MDKWPEQKEIIIHSYDSMPRSYLVRFDEQSTERIFMLGPRYGALSIGAAYELANAITDLAEQLENRADHVNE